MNYNYVIYPKKISCLNQKFKYVNVFLAINILFNVW